MDTQASQYAVAWVVGGGESAVCTRWRQMDFETSLVTAPCPGPQLLGLILSHTCRLKGMSEILFLEHCWFQAATHAFQTHSCSKHHATPDCAPPKQQKRTLLWSFLFAEEHPSGSLAFTEKDFKGNAPGERLTPANIRLLLFLFLGPDLCAFFPCLSPLLTTACSVVPGCFHLFSGSHRGEILSSVPVMSLNHHHLFQPRLWPTGRHSHQLLN